MHGIDCWQMIIFSICGHWMRLSMHLSLIHIFDFFCFAMVNPSLQALAIVHFGNDLVHCDQQDDVDNGVE